MRKARTPVVMVISDDPELSQQITGLLRAGGLTVDLVAQIDRGLEVWRCNQHDLVLFVEGKNSKTVLEFSRQLRSISYGEHTPLVLVCREDQPDAGAWFLELGNSDTLLPRQVQTHLLAKVCNMVKASRAQLALITGLEQMREVQLLARMGQWAWYPEDGVIRFDENAERLFDQILQGELSLDNYLERVHPEDRYHVQGAFFELAWGGEHRIEYRLLERDGRIRHVAQRGSAFLRGGEIEYDGVIQDVTCQHLNVERLLLAEHVLDNLPVAIAITDLQGKRIYANAAAGQKSLDGLTSGWDGQTKIELSSQSHPLLNAHGKQIATLAIAPGLKPSPGEAAHC